MLRNFVAFRLHWFACALLACACGGSGKDTGNSAKTGQNSGRFAGRYEVPVEAALAAAATYPVREIDWGVNGGVASLSYDLPVELLGRSLAIELSGPASESSARLSGKTATADCTIGPAEVVCTENLAGLLPLNPDLNAVAALAEDTYAGSAQDRVNVTQLFAVDPIGVVHIELGARLDE